MAYSQDPSFSQIENSHYYSHPSDLLLRQGYELELVHRSQWNNISEAYTTNFLSFFYQDEKMKSGYGIKLLQDIEGVGKLKTEDVKFVYRYSLIPYSYYKPRSLFIALEGGFIRKSIDWTQLTFSDQIDPVFGIYTSTGFHFPDYNSISFFDAGFSVTYRDKLKMSSFRLPYSASLSLRHLHRAFNFWFYKPDESLLRMETMIPTALTITVSTTIHSIDFYGLPLLKPILRYESQGNLKKITYGSLIGKANELKQSTIYTGLFISNQYNPFSPFNTNSFILLVGFEKIYNKHLLSFAYSYDINTTGLGNGTTAGTHEITLNISFSTIENGFNQPSNTFQKCPEN